MWFVIRECYMDTQRMEFRSVQNKETAERLVLAEPDHLLLQVDRRSLPAEEERAAQLLLKGGQIIEEFNIWLLLPTMVHLRVLTRLLYRQPSGVTVTRADGLAAFIKLVLERMNAQTLRNSKARAAEASSIYERHCQVEFYR